MRVGPAPEPAAGPGPALATTAEACRPDDDDPDYVGLEDVYHGIFAGPCTAEMIA